MIIITADDPTVVSTEHADSCHGHDLHHAVVRQPSVDSHDHDHHKVSTDVLTVVSTEHSDSGHDHDHRHHAVVRQPSVGSHDHDHHKVISLKNFDDDHLDHGHDHHHNH